MCHNNTPDTYLSRRIERLKHHGTQFVLLNGKIFKRYNQIIVPDGSFGVSLTVKECRQLLKNLGGWIVQWTDGLESDSTPSEWYSVICKRFTKLENMSSDKRRYIRRSLDNCQVRMISSDELADYGYPVFCATLKSYDNKLCPPTIDTFKNGILRETKFPDLFHNWGVFKDDRMIGFAQNQLFGNSEVNYSSAKFHPDFLDLYPGYALIYCMNQYYLEVMGFSCVNAGKKTISHESQIQAFLISKFGFEKVYTTLHLYYRFPLGLLVKMAYPFRGFLKKINHQMKVVLELEQCRRTPHAPSDRRTAQNAISK